MLILRIRQAECAMRDGRLDEAYALVIAPDLRSHRSGQDLVGRLSRALMERGRTHLAAGRLDAAAGDCEKAERLGGALVEVAQLRAALREAANHRANEERRKAQLLADARGQIDRGQLSVGEHILHDLSMTEPLAANLRNEVAHRRAAVESLAKHIEQMLEHDDWAGACDEIARAERATQNDARVRELVTRIARDVQPQVRAALVEGRLDQADTILSRLERIDGAGVETQHLRQILKHCRSAWAALEAGRLREAQESARRLAALLPEASWLSAVNQRLTEATTALEEVRGGPLGLLNSPSPDLHETTPGPRPRPLPRTGPPPLPKHSPVVSDNLPESFTLQVDGVGSFRVLRKWKVTIGPVSSSRLVDVPLLADASLPTITIERNEEDYFLKSELPVMINDKVAISKLLRNGDRIVLGRCRITFVQPNPASTTVMLQMQGARLSRSDLRGVVLLDRELMIGPGSQAHVRAEALSAPLALLVRDGKLTAQAQENIEINGQPMGRAAALAMGVPALVGTLGFVVTRD